MAGWHVYIVQCADGTYYTGISNDVPKRLTDHNAGKGAKYTRGRAPITLVYQEACDDKACASRREYAIKRLSRTEKQALIGVVSFLR